MFTSLSEWAVAGIVVAVIGGGWTIVKAVANIIQPLTTAITKLNENMKNITKDLSELTERNSKTHDKLFSIIDQHDQKLTEHEVRIVKLEEHESHREK